jgi:hypothetical protein
LGTGGDGETREKIETGVYPLSYSCSGYLLDKEDLVEKEPFLRHWAKQRANQRLNPKPVRYTHEGSTYAEDGIRITGRKAFVDSVLSRLKDLLQFESEETRLQVVYKKSTDRESGKTLTSYNCYVQVHARGGVPAKKKAKKKQTR